MSGKFAVVDKSTGNNAHFNMSCYSYALIDVDTEAKNKSNVVLRSLHSYEKRYSSSHWSTSTTNFDHCDDEYVVDASIHYATRPLSMW